jgi:hypothetical protein
LWELCAAVGKGGEKWLAEGGSVLYRRRGNGERLKAAAPGVHGTCRWRAALPAVPDVMLVWWEQGSGRLTGEPVSAIVDFQIALY